MYYCYILESETTGRMYIGQTNNIEDRLIRHNKGETFSTRNRGPWKIIFTKAFETRSEAMKLEKKLKSWKNPTKVREWIKYQKGDGD